MSKFLLIPLLFVTSCAHRTLNSDDNHRSINVYAKKYKTAYIFFYDSTKVKVTSLHIENHVVYWTDVTTNASDHDSLCVIRKIGFYDRELGCGIGALSGVAAGFLVTAVTYMSSSKGPSFTRPLEHAAVGIGGIFAMGAFGLLGSTLGYMGGYPIEFVNTQ